MVPLRIQNIYIPTAISLYFVLVILCCDIWSLQWELSATIVATSQTQTWWKFQATLLVNDLSHSYISACRYAISGPLLWYIGPAASNISGL